MRAITFLRGAAWVGVAILGWSLNVRWGIDPNLPNGPPGQWQRQVVGAMLLGFIAAVSISASGRGQQPPSWVARGIALGAAVLIAILCLQIRSDAHSSGFPEMLDGSGFLWMLSGGGLILGAVVGTLGLRPPEDAKPERSKGKKRRGSKPRKKSRARR